MIRYGCFLLSLGVVIVCGCQSGRSADVKLPRNPQYAKVQTPVLHPMPVPRRSVTLACDFQPYNPRPMTIVPVSEPGSDYIDLQPVILPVEPSPRMVEESPEIAMTPTITMDASWIESARVQIPRPQTPEQSTLETLTVEQSSDTAIPNESVVVTLDSVELLSGETQMNDLSFELLDVDGTIPKVSTEPNQAVAEEPQPTTMPTIEEIDESLVLLDHESKLLTTDISLQQDTAPITITPDQVPDTSKEKVTEVASEPVVLEAPQPVVPEVRPETYEVHKGDTLWSIATRFYGNGQRWLDIARLNRIYRADQISTGTVLRLP